MEEDQILDIPDEGNLPDMYSKRAVIGFSILGSTLFGGVLLFLNIRSIGKNNAALVVLLFSIVYTAMAIYIVNIPERPQSSITYLLNIIGGVFLSEFFYRKYLGDDKQYQKKKIWKPLIILILISVLFVWAAISDF